jgi:hypothetical protein
MICEIVREVGSITNPEWRVAEVSNVETLSPADAPVETVTLMRVRIPDTWLGDTPASDAMKPGKCRDK